METETSKNTLKERHIPKSCETVTTASEIGEGHKGTQLLTIPQIINLADTRKSAK